MIDIIHLITSLILLYFSVLGYGLLIKNKKVDYDIFIIFLAGYFFIGIIGLLIHFFIPIDSNLSVAIIVFGIILLVLKKKHLNQKIIINYLIIYLTFSILLVGYSDHAIDSNMYHHPYVSYLKSSKIIFGIANIEFRFGHISFLQYVQAALSNNYLNLISLSAPNFLIYSLFLIYSGEKIFSKNKNKITYFFVLIISSFVLIKLGRYREFGNDLIPFLVASYFLIILFDNYYKKNNFNFFYLGPLFAIFIFSHKISYIFSVLIFLTIFTKDYFINLLKEKKVLSISIFISLIWLLKNFITTSCLAYPVYQTCIQNTEWYLTGISDPLSAARLSELWAKAFIANPNWQNINLDNYINSFAWVDTWLQSHFIKILEKLSPIFILLIILSGFLYFGKQVKNKIKKINYAFFYKLFILIFIGLVIWFLNAPLFRYGSFYIVSFISVIFIFFNLKKILNFDKKILNKLNYIFIFSIVFFTLKNINRQINSDNYFFPETVKNNKNYEIANHKPLILKPKKETLNQCFYTFAICSHEIPKEFKVIKKNNYYLIK